MPEIDDTDPRNENPYTVRRERTETRHLLRGRRRASLSFPTQDSTLVSYDSTDIESNIIRPIEAGQSEPPSRTGTPTGTPTRTPTLHNFNISSPSDHSSVNTIPTPTSSELRVNQFYHPHFNKDKTSLSYKTIFVYNQYTHHIVQIGQQLHPKIR